jgi:hypothetical protein
MYIETYHSANLHILADDRYINAETNVYNKIFEIIYLGLLKLATIMVFLFGLLCTNNGHRFYNKPKLFIICRVTDI